MVPWRDADVLEAIRQTAPIDDEAWAKPYWRPKKSWAFAQRSKMLIKQLKNKVK